MRFDVKCRGGGWWHVLMQVDTTGENVKVSMRVKLIQYL